MHRSSPQRSRTGRAALVLLAVGLALAPVAPVSAGGWGKGGEAGLLAPAPEGCAVRRNVTERQLLQCLTPAGALRHLQAFQRIAEANGGTRASGTPGYDASVDHVVRTLRRAGYEPEVQPFEFPYYDDDATATLDGEVLEPFSFVTGEGDYAVMTYSGSGSVATTALVPTNDVVVPIGENPPNTSTSGCEPEDFAPAPVDVGAVALVQRGECPFLQKALNAQDAGYDAVVVFNEGQPERDGVVLGTLGADAVGVLTIPVIGVSYDLGVQLIEEGGELALEVEVVAETRETANVVAELAGRTDDNVVMVGAHLDSVPEGPGINDNGSGSAAILEVARAMARTRPHNTVRFAWWGAEEFGLIGSWEYVEGLDDAERARIAVYLNLDMVASPNYVRFVYDGDQSTYEAPVPVPAGSDAIEAMFREHYARRGLPAEDTEFSGRSDYEAFISYDIPSGGLFTGAEEVKTPEQAEVYGGVAGVPFDPCYHQPCDDLVPPNAVPELQQAYGRALLANVNLRALDEHLHAIGATTLALSASTERVNGVPGRRPPGSRARARAAEVPPPVGGGGPGGGHDHHHAEERPAA